jgi:Rha family phage regulatory protein
LKIAEVFGRQHKNVLKKIDGLECSAEFRNRNFAVSSKNNDLGNFKHQKYYTLTEAGSYLITFGFGGVEAMGFTDVKKTMILVVVYTIHHDS